MRVVVLGGQGNFGRRICWRLLQTPGVEVLAGGRSRRDHSGNDADREAGHEASAPWVFLDHRAGDFEARLSALAPRLLIHCAGPFQGQNYRVALAAAGAGAHYIDLADGRAFVEGFRAAVDDAARRAGVAAITGASTLPALSSAAVDALSDGMSTVREVRTVIAPAQQATRGAATLSGVFSYAGRPFDTLIDGQSCRLHGWQRLRRVSIPGMRDRWSAACDVPDLAVFPERYPGIRTVLFSAALEVGMQHALLWLVAALRWAGVPVPVERWASPLDRAAGFLDRFGTALGGMRVDVKGEDAAGKAVHRTWQVLADDNHGPEIPCMATLLLALRLLRDGRLPAGASVCMGLLALDDFQPEFARWGMRTGIEAINSAQSS
jgi:hypothetical protein